MSTLSTLSAFITKGSTPTTYGFKWESSGVLFLRSECVAETGLDLAQSMFISDAAHASLRRSTVKHGDLLVTITGNVGRLAVFRGTEDANINQHIARVRISGQQACSQFVYQYLSLPQVRSRFKAITTGQAYPQISLKQVRDTLIPLPPTKTEQDAIAKALSDADALIESLEHLLRKKRNLKQGAMQELLTGKKRLPGFNGMWEATHLGSLLRFQVGFPFSSAFFNEEGQGIRLVKNRDLKSDDQVFSYSGNFAEQFLVRDGDVLVGMDGDFLPCLWAKGPALLNQRVGRIVPFSGLDLSFALYYLVRPLKEIEDATSSTTVKHLTHGDIEDIEKPLPPVEEQVAIAAILSDMDAEIAALEAKLTKTRQLKQSMMQELLSGKIRLV